MEKRDIIVIGGGAAGISAAVTAAGFGKNTLLIEKNKMGGECTWKGCIPSKALLHLAELRRAAVLAGADPPVPSDIFSQVDTVRRAVYNGETPEALQKRGVESLIGNARFLDPRTVEVNDIAYRAHRFILTVGSSPLIPPIPGLKSASYLTNENVFELESVPSSLLVMGGGPIGMELAQAFVRLGSSVTVVEMMDRLLPREDEDIADAAREVLEAEGVTLLTGTKAAAVKSRSAGITLTVENSEGKRELKASALLVAVGRNTATDGLDLAAADIRTTPKGVEVDSRLKTSNPRVFAAGDVAGPYAFSHMAEYQGVLAAMNAVLPFRRRADYNHVPWVTFTEPEIARTGLTEQEARERYGDGVKVYTHSFTDLDRGRTAPGTRGLVKIILNSSGKVLGAHIAGPRAGELICEIQVLKTLGIPYGKLRGVIHPYPTWADILRQIAKRVALDRVLNHPVVRLARKLSRK